MNAPASEQAPADHHPTWMHYGLTFLIYVLLGLQFRTVVLNWIIGPIWLILTLCYLPMLLRALSTKARGQRRGAAE